MHEPARQRLPDQTREPRNPPPGGSTPRPASPAPIAEKDPPTAAASMGDECRHMVYRRGDQLWTFRWDRGFERDLVQAVTSLADDCQRPFDWVDAAVVCHCLGQTTAATPE